MQKLAQLLNALYRSSNSVRHLLALAALSAASLNAFAAIPAPGHQLATTTGRIASPKATLKGVPRFGEVTPMLFRGGRPSPMGLKALNKLGVNIVVDLRGTDKHERRLAHSLGMRYVAIPWHCPFPGDKVFVRFLTLLRENPSKKVFVHCRLGDDRTGMMVAAYRMAEQGWSAPEAAKEMRAYGFSPLHHVICPGLAEYEEHFPDHLKKDPALRALRATQTARR